jgi:hypothetical protein
MTPGPGRRNKRARLSDITKEAFVTHKLGLLPPEKIKKAGEIFSCLFKLCVF